MAHVFNVTDALVRTFYMMQFFNNDALLYLRTGTKKIRQATHMYGSFAPARKGLWRVT